MLVQTLSDKGMKAVLTREPGGTPGAEAIRSLLLDPNGEGWGPEAEALLFAAARSDHVARLIQPALSEGKWVISDRFLDSSRAYQGGQGGLDDEAVMSLHRIGSSGLLPDMTVLIEIDPDAAAERLAKRDAGATDRIGGRDEAYHRKVAENFRRFAAAEPHRFVVVSGDGSPENVHDRICQALMPLIRHAA